MQFLENAHVQAVVNINFGLIDTGIYFASLGILLLPFYLQFNAFVLIIHLLIWNYE